MTYKLIESLTYYYFLVLCTAFADQAERLIKADIVVEIITAAYVIHIVTILPIE